MTYRFLVRRRTLSAQLLATEARPAAPGPGTCHGTQQCHVPSSVLTCPPRLHASISNHRTVGVSGQDRNSGLPFPVHCSPGPHQQASPGGVNRDHHDGHNDHATAIAAAPAPFRPRRPCPRRSQRPHPGPRRPRRRRRPCRPLSSALLQLLLPPPPRAAAGAAAASGRRPPWMPSPRPAAATATAATATAPCRRCRRPHCLLQPPPQRGTAAAFCRRHRSRRPVPSAPLRASAAASCRLRCPLRPPLAAAAPATCRRRSNMPSPRPLATTSTAAAPCRCRFPPPPPQAAAAAFCRRPQGGCYSRSLAPPYKRLARQVEAFSSIPRPADSRGRG